MSQIKASINSYYNRVYPSERGMRMYLASEYPELSNKEIDGYVDDFYSDWKGDVYRPKREVKKFSKFNETVVDRMHQMDLMEMPKDSRHRWIYLLTYIDVASRKAYAVGITNKLPNTIKKALLTVYEHMNVPSMLQTDSGGEFCNPTVDEYLSSLGVKHIVTKEKNHQAIVERFNQTLAAPLFRYMDKVEEESNVSGKKFNRWSDILSDVIDDYNNRYHNGLEGIPQVAYQFDVIPESSNREIYIDGDVLPVGTSVRIPRRTSKMNKRSTDSDWSSKVYFVSGSVKKSEYDPMKYRLMDSNLGILDGTYYREELLVVEDNTTLKGYSLGDLSYP